MDMLHASALTAALLLIAACTYVDRPAPTPVVLQQPPAVVQTPVVMVRPAY